MSKVALRRFDGSIEKVLQTTLLDFNYTYFIRNGKFYPTATEDGKRKDQFLCSKCLYSRAQKHS